MKLLNICDPYVHEFFFGGRQIIVEGDTEYTAFSMIREMYPDEYSDIQIIRARGKGIIPSVAKVLLQFSKEFTILHDADEPLTAKGAANPAWGMNSTIGKLLELDGAADRIRLVACKSCFEDSMFDVEVTKEKPYHTLQMIKTDPAAAKRVKELLDYLLGINPVTPAKCVEWKAITDLLP